MNFEFFGSTQIVFGCGALSQLGGMAKSCGKNAIVVTGSGSINALQLTDLLADQGLSFTQFKVVGEPSILVAKQAASLAKEANADFVIGFGGGSVIDCAKAVSAMITNPGTLLDYLEVVGKNQPLIRPGAPVIAIPTTAGTGSEVTRNSVLSVPGEKVKVSLRSVNILPRIALVDPYLTVTMPPSVTASSGMDAFTQLLESYLTPRATIITDQLAIVGLEHIARSILQAYQDGQDIKAREDMSLGSLLSGMTLTNAGLGVVHGFAGPIGGLYNAPHGTICASLLASSMKINLSILQKLDPHHPALSRFIEVSRILTGNKQAKVEDGLVWITSISKKLDIPRLSSLGIKKSDFDLIIEKSSRSSSMKGNPVQLSREDLYQILEDAL